MKKRLSRATAKREDNVNKERELKLFFETLKSKPNLLEELDAYLWITLAKKNRDIACKTCVIFFENGVSVRIDVIQ